MDKAVTQKWQVVLTASHGRPPRLFIGPISSQQAARKVAEVFLALGPANAVVSPYRGPEPDMINANPVEPRW
jgi:hypothetical protein